MRVWFCSKWDDAAAKSKQLSLLHMNQSEVTQSTDAAVSTRDESPVRGIKLLGRVTARGA